MATNNKTLNQSQRKALDKLYQQQFTAVEANYIDKCNRIFDDGIKAMNDNISDEEFTHFLSAQENANYWKKKLEEKYNNNSTIEFKYDNQSDSYKLGYHKDVYRYGSKQWNIDPEITKLKLRREEAKKKFETTRLEATAKIYGLDVTFKAIRKDIDAMLAKLA